MISANLTYQWLSPAIFVSAGVAFLLLYYLDRKQSAAVKISAGYFWAAIGYTLVVLAGPGLPKVQQAIIQTSLIVSHFLMVWGIASLYGRAFPKLAFGLPAMIACGLIVWSFIEPEMYWMRVAADFGFVVWIDLICGVLVWRAREHPVDVAIAAIYAIQMVLTAVRVIQLFEPGLDTLTLEALVGSPLASSIHTANAIFAIVIGLAVCARYAVTLITRLNRLAETDPLTGLLNRRAFETRVAMARAEAAPLPSGLIICDIDNFKRVNDTHGHDTGDAALKAVAAVLSRLSGETAICARLGGEEFCVLLPGASAEVARLVATQMRIGVQTRPIAARSGTIKLTASFGYCDLAPDEDFRLAMTRTDAAVYQAKSDGRNLVRMAGGAEADLVDLRAVPGRVA